MSGVRIVHAACDGTPPVSDARPARHGPLCQDHPSDTHGTEGELMAGGLAALLDDIAALAKLAAASVDDVGAAAGRASAKAAGVVIDDTAVTPRYVHRLHPGPRAADHPADRRRVAAQQAAVHPARRPAAQPVPAVAAHADPHGRRHVPLPTRAPRRSGSWSAATRRSTPPHRSPTQGAGHREVDGQGRDPHRLHPVGRDHGHRPQRGRRRAVRVPGDHPGRGRAGDHRLSSTASSRSS